MLLVVFSIEFALHHARVADAVAQADVDHRPAHLVAGGCVVHHFDALDAVGRQRLQQGIELSAAHVGHLAVQYHRHPLHAQRQRAVLLHHAGQFLQGFVDIVHGAVLDHPRQVVFQLARRCLDDGAFAHHHHFGQMAVEAVHTGIARNKTVSRQRPLIFFLQILLCGKRQSPKEAACPYPYIPIHVHKLFLIAATKVSRYKISPRYRRLTKSYRVLSDGIILSFHPPQSPSNVALSSGRTATDGSRRQRRGSHKWTGASPDGLRG